LRNVCLLVVDNYRFNNRIDSKSEAVRRLIEKALGAPKKPKK